MDGQKYQNLKARLHQGYDPNTEFKETGSLLSAADFADQSLDTTKTLFDRIKDAFHSLKKGQAENASLYSGASELSAQNKDFQPSQNSITPHEFAKAGLYVDAVTLCNPIVRKYHSAIQASQIQTILQIQSKRLIRYCRVSFTQEALHPLIPNLP